MKIEDGSARSLIKKFDVKKREYFGNTSMEAEISLLMANQTLVRSWWLSNCYCLFFTPKGISE
jgi:tRNA G10  N-methylase Trm11